MISQPKAPDPYATAAAQGQMDKSTAIAQQELNAVNQTTPQGTLNYSQTGTWADGTPQLSVTQTYSPEQQHLYDLGNQTQTNLGQIGVQQSAALGNLLNTPFSLSPDAIAAQSAGMPNLPQYMPSSGMYGTSGDPFWNTSHGQLANVVAQAGNVGPAAPNARYTDASGTQTAAPGQIPGQYDAAPTAVQTSHLQDPTQVQARYLQDPTQVQTRYLQDPTQVATRQIGSNDQLENQLYDAAFQRYQPQLDRQRQSTEADLANRGLRPGSTGYDTAMQGVDNAENDLRSQTFLNGQNQAFGQAATRAQNDFSQDLQSNGQFFNQLATQSQNNFGQDLQSNGQLYNQLATQSQNNFGQDLQANGQYYGQLATKAQNNFSQDLAANGQLFTQQDTANQHNFGQDLQKQGQAFQQVLAANGQNFQQALGANAQNYGQDATNAQYAQARDAMLFSNYNTAFNAANAGQNAMFTQGLSGNQFDVAQQQANYGYGMGNRQQALNELTAQRQEPLNEISALLGGSQVSRPSWTATPQATIQPPNLTGLVQSNYQTQMAGYNGLLGGLAGLGGSLARGATGGGLFSLSDERVKHDVKRIARLPSGLGVYSYCFADGRREIGLLAQEVLLHDPSAVTIRDDGLLAVDYARALEAA